MIRISVIGSGYIGLVIGACLANDKNKVVLADIDLEKINRLKNNIFPIYEPDLNDLLLSKIRHNLITFTNDISLAIRSSQLIFLTVGTPTGSDGQSDIGAIKSVAQVISDNLNEKKIICIKSTVPIGTHKIIDEIINKSNNQVFNADIVSLPEFLREGTAISDFINPDRIIIGTKEQKTFLFLNDFILSTTKCNANNILWTDNTSAETIKYIANSFLALKVSFINEVANLCDKIGVDILEVSRGIGLDKRIAPDFLKPGPGYGGSCFPKDVLALKQTAQDLNMELKTINAAIEINKLQKKHVVRRLKNLMNNKLENKLIAVFGLSFKQNTDDVRQSPAIDIINYLNIEKAKLKLHDPKAINNMRLIYPNLHYYEDAYDAVKDVDAILILTDWEEFKNLDFDKIGQLVKERVVFDTRNVLDINRLQKLNFTCDTIGRQSICNPNFFQSKNRTSSVIMDNQISHR